MAKVVERCLWLMIRVVRWSDDVICCLRVGWSCRVMFMRGELCFEASWCSGEVFMVNDKCCVTLGRRWMMFECKVKQVIDDYVSTESERAWIFRATHPNFFLFLISDFIICRTYSLTIKKCRSENEKPTKPRTTKFIFWWLNNAVLIDPPGTKIFRFQKL